MRLVFFSVVMALSLLLVLFSFIPLLISEEIFSSTESNQVIFNKAISNIKKINIFLDECIEQKKLSDEIEGNFTEESGITNNIRSILRDTELILIYQNYLIAKNSYIDLREKFLRREVTSAEVNSAYRDYESAKLYLDRMLKLYPEGLNLLRFSPEK